MKCLLINTFILLLASCTSNPPKEEYVRMAEEMNSYTPFEYNKGMRLDSVKAVSQSRFKYYYTLLNDPNSSEGAFREKVKPQIIANLSASASSKKFKEDGMIIIYSYRTKNGDLFSEFSIPSTEY